MKGMVVHWALVAFFFFGVCSYAQESSIQNNTTKGGQVSEKSYDDVIAKMRTDLSLTQEQAEAIRPVIKEYMAKRKEILQGSRDRGITDRAVGSG